jgi:CRISPR-associated exonuclease Cas4
MIRASDLNRFVYCPRSIYLADVLGVEPERSFEFCMGVVGHAVRRELNLRQARLLSGVHSVEDADAVLSREVDGILADLPRISAENWIADYSVFLPVLRAELSAELEALKSELSAMEEDMGFDEALAYLTPKRIDCALRSESLNLSGRVDKVLDRGFPAPVDVKTGAVSEYARDGDAVQLCAYGMLLEDESDLGIPYGFIEYARTCERRPVMFTEKLRGKVIQARDSVAEILSGAVPTVCPHGEPKKCAACNFKERCYEI